MTDKQLKNRLLREVQFHIPYAPPTGERPPYETGGVSCSRLLPSTPRPWIYAAGTAAGAVLLAGATTAAILLLPREPVVSVESGKPSHTASAVSTEDTSVCPQTDPAGNGTDNTASSETTTQTQSQGTVTSQTPAPTEPQRPETEQKTRIRQVNYDTIIMENGDVYKTNPSGPVWEKETIPDGCTYMKPQKIYTNAAAYYHDIAEVKNGDSQVRTVEILLSKNGTLSAKGFVPTASGTFRQDLEGPDPFIADHCTTLEAMTPIDTGVKQIVPQFYLKENGDLYVYGFVWGKAYTPTKLLGNVVAVSREWNRLFAVTADHQLWEADLQGETAIPFKKVAENVKTAGVYGSRNYYITLDDELFMWGTYATGSYAQTDDAPVKYADNVQKAEIDSYGFCYLTNTGDLYRGGMNTEHEINESDRTYYPTGIKIASRVKDFVYSLTHYYITQNGELHGALNAFHSMMDLTYPPLTDTEAGKDRVLLNDVDYIRYYDGRGMAVTKSGEIYAWGWNTIELYEGDKPFSFSIVPPRKLNPLP